MKRITISILLSFFFLFSISFAFSDSVQNTLDSLSAKINSIDSNVKQNTKVIDDLNCKISDAELHKKLEIIEKDIYERDHKNAMDNVTVLLYFTEIFFTLALGFLGYSWIISSKKMKDEFEKKIDKFSIEADKKIEENVNTFKVNIVNKLNETEASFYYQFAIRFFNQGKYEIALEFFTPLHNSKFRHSEVCLYLSKCYFYTNKFNEEIVEYLKEALNSTNDNAIAYGIFKFMEEILQKNILREEVCKLLGEEKSNPGDYYKENTKELINRLLDKYCNQIQV